MLHKAWTLMLSGSELSGQTSCEQWWLLPHVLGWVYWTYLSCRQIIMVAQSDVL